MNLRGKMTKPELVDQLKAMVTSWGLVDVRIGHVAADEDVRNDVWSWRGQVPGSAFRLADQKAVDPELPLEFVLLMFRAGEAQAREEMAEWRDQEA